MTTQTTSPEALWRVFAPLVAARPAMRISHDGGARYRGGRRLSAERPLAPAAVPTYAGDGTTTCLCLDFDTGRAGRQKAAADAETFAALIRACGGVAVIDRSPSGGRHVYVPMQRPRRIEDIKPLMVGLVARYRTTLDKTPMWAVTGAIRPPGATHPSGGHQELVTPIEEAVAAFQLRNSDGVWSRLCAAIGPVDYVPHAAGGLSSRLIDAPHAHRPGGRAPLPPAYDAIARLGQYDPASYGSPSEARQAVLTSAYIRGWTLGEVAAAMDGGDWQGLRGFYLRYDRRERARALHRDWLKAASWASSRSDGSNSDTRGSTHTPPRDRHAGELGHLRTWWSAMRAAERLRYRDRGDQSTRLLLRGLSASAERRGSRYVKVGCRSLALATTLSHQTVAVGLRRLRDEEDPLLRLIDGDRGHGNADIYELTIPEAHTQLAERRRWRGGRLESIHPAFSVLGAPAALVYDALRESSEPIGTVREVAESALMERHTAGLALNELAAYGLAENGPSGWMVGPADLEAVADVLGALEWHQERVERYRGQRRRYRERLATMARERAQHESTVPHASIDDLWVAGVREPDVEDQGETVIELLERTLGAVLVPT